MKRNIVMTGSLIKVENLFAGVDRLIDPDLDPTGINAQSNYGIGKNPQVTLSCPPDNQYPVFIQEHIDSAPNERIWLHGGGSNVMDFANTKALNIFYVIGTPGDILFIECR